MHGINSGDSTEQIIQDVGISIAVGTLTQSILVGYDAHVGKLSNTILKSYAIDGGLRFGASQLLRMGGILIGKNMWRKRELFI